MHLYGDAAVGQEEHGGHAAEVDPFAEVEATPGLEPVRQFSEGLRRDLRLPRQLHLVLAEIAVLAEGLPAVHAPGEKLPDLVGVVRAVGCRVLLLDLLAHLPRVVVVDPHAGVRHQPLAPVVRIRAVRKLADHDEVPLVLHLAVEDLLGVGFLLEAGLVLRIVAGRRDDGHQGLPALAEGVQLDVVQIRRRVRVVFVDDDEGRRAGVLVLDILRQGPHPSAQLPGPDRQALRNDQVGRDLRAGLGDLPGVAEDAHRLAAVHGHAVHLGAALILCQLRMPRRVQRIAAHMVQALPGLLGALEVPAGALLIGDREAPLACIFMHPAVYAAEVELLPVLQLHRLPGLRAAALDAEGEPPIDPVRPGHVEDVGKVGIADPLQIVQVPLAGLDLIRPAVALQSSGRDLFGVHRDRVRQDLVPARHLSTGSAPGASAPDPRRGPWCTRASGPARRLCSARGRDTSLPPRR